MIENQIKEQLDLIQKRIQDYKIIHHDHAATCKFLLSKYEVAMETIQDKDSPKAKAFVVWNRWFAPRILFEGIADPELLMRIENLHLLLIQIIDIENLEKE